MTDNERRQFAEMMGIDVANDMAIKRWFAEKMEGWRLLCDATGWRFVLPDGSRAKWYNDWNPLTDISQAIGMLTTPYVIASPDSFTDEGLGPRGDTFQVTVFKAHDMILTDGDGDDWELGESTDIKVAILLAVGRAVVAKEKGEKA